MEKATKATTRAGHRIIRLLVCLVALVSPSLALAQIAQTPPELEHVGVTEHLDQALPLGTVFRDQTGKSVKLGDYFDGKRPVVLTFAWHSCPVLCSMVLRNAVQGLKGVDWTLGGDYQALTISIDPKESLERTAGKRHSILTQYARLPVISSSAGDSFPGVWPFLVGDEKALATVENAAGFEAQYDPDDKQWAHPSVVMIVTPDGKMARYLYGLEFSPNDLRLGLLEASKGRSISTIEQIILYCYHYDPKGGKYVLVARRVMQVGGASVAIVLFGVLATLWGRELRRRNKEHTGRGETLSPGRAESAV